MQILSMLNHVMNGKLEAEQYNACLAITAEIRGTSRECLCRELSLKTLNDRRWSHKLFFFHKIIKAFSPAYLCKQI